MALQGKSRNNKRSSSSTSYASTITMVVFVGLCFLGVWMLTSNSVIPPQTSTRATTSTHSEESSQLVFKPETTPIATSFEDNPGDLPDDAIKNDDPPKQESGSVDQTVQEDQQTVETHLTLTDPNQQEQNTSTTTTTVSDNSQNEVVVEKVEEEKNREQRQEDESNDNIVNSQTEDQRQQQELESISSNENTQTESQIEGTSTTTTTPLNDQHEEKTTIKTKNDQSTEHEFTDVTNQEIQPQKQEDDDNNNNKGSTSTSASASATTSTGSNSGESFPGGDNSGIPKESKESKKSWSTQAAQSENEKERRKDESDGQDGIYGYTWHLCNVTAGPDYIPCLDNEKALKQLRSTKHFEHRERHCPEEGPTCLVPVPEGYKRSIEWPTSRDKVIRNHLIMS